MDDSELKEVTSPMLKDENLGSDLTSRKAKEKVANGDSAHKIEIEIEKPRHLLFRVNEVPPFHMMFIFALQQTLLVISSPLSLVLLLAEIVCMESDEYLKLQVLSAVMFITGLSTFLMSTYGVRLSIFQGPAKSYIIPLLAMQYLDEWKCPATFKEFDPASNTTIIMAMLDDNTTMPARDLSIQKIGIISGSLIGAGVIHFFIGVTGLVGVLCRYIGPITIVPTIVLIGLNIYGFVVKFMEPSVGVTCLVIFTNLVLSLFLGKKDTPLPWWNSSRGFHIVWWPLHQAFSILISMLIGWAVSGILTVAGAFTDDPDSKEFMARTDARNFVIGQSDWFMIPYPGKIAAISFNPGVFVSFLIASILSVLDSIGDYAASARMSRVTHPPAFAFNRGIAVEGICSMLGGAMGCCVATVSYGANIGAMGITRVVSRRVFQVVGLFFVIFSVVGKIGAVFITIPYPVLGGTTLITIGIFIGVVLSYLKTVDLSSTRNLAIIGISLLSGLVMPNWVSRNRSAINTGDESLDLIITMLLSNPSFIGGVLSCSLDNLIPGTLEERGLLEQLQELEEEEDKQEASTYEDGPEVYRLPFLPQSFRQSKFAKYVPLFEYEDPEAIVKKNSSSK